MRSLMGLLEVMMSGNYYKPGTNIYYKCRAIIKTGFLLSLLLILSTSFALAQNVDKNSLCPIASYININSPSAFADRFKGDTITFTVPKVNDAYFESFKLLVPDTIWIKEKPKYKLPQEHEHFKLVSNYCPVSGWGVNAHRQYTPGYVLEQNQFILRGNFTENIQYLGTFKYIILEDIKTGSLIKWDYSKNENKGLIILSSSIRRHLSLMKGLDFLLEESDASLIPAICSDVSFSIEVKQPKIWLISLYAHFETAKGFRSSYNWEPPFFLKKDEEKLIRSLNHTISN